ncbi:thioredoxin domain-containing protein [Acetobacter sp. LMG 1627]|uniref:Thioredoxin domain-containing protein n=2 Tax=Acetobacter conturbans TaxID=1737472 RepID=A0ABX0JYI3_9PROT|nr:thioredoxin domain-containing protein [Acetobacter conturbans]
MTRTHRFPVRAALLAALASASLFASFSARADDGFTAAQRQEIVEIVRSALKQDPTILGDAITAMRAQGEAAQQAASLRAIHDNAGKLETSDTDVVLGNPHGSVTIVEFYDPRCPYCRKVLPIIDKLVADEPDLRLVEKVIPVLGPNSQLEAQALLAAARQNGYMKFQHALMTNSEAPSIEHIRAVATSVGLDAARLETDMKGAEVGALLRSNLELARKVGVDGTPTFIVGEKTIIPGAASESDLRAAIAAARKAK